MSLSQSSAKKMGPTLRILDITVESAELFPPLKSIADIIGEITDLVVRFRTCTDEWKNFQTYVQRVIAATLQPIESSNLEQSEVIVQVAKLHSTLTGIVKRIEKRQKDSLLVQMRHFLDHPIVIAEMRSDVDNAIEIFKLGTAVRTEAKTEQILEWTKQQCQKTNPIHVLDPVLSKLPYAKGASWDPYRGCLPNTREGIISSVLSWVNDRGAPSGTNIFLLTGVAGAGKSAIAHTIAEQLSNNKQLATSFFFDRQTAERNNPKWLVSTIATDLGLKNDQFGRRIILAIEEDNSLVRAPISRQFQHLILGPSQNFVYNPPHVIVIDALDEGYDLDLLRVLCKDTPGLPRSLRIFLTSRMSPDIERLRREPHVHSVELDLHMQDNLDDTALFARSKLKEVADYHDLGNDWPDSQLVDLFNTRAEGLFLWVTTTCEYLKSRYDPQTDLEALLSGLHPQSSAESKMDNLYATILQACNWDNSNFSDSFRTLLGATVALRSPLSLRAMNELYQRTIMRSEPALRQLSPLLTGLSNKPNFPPVRFIHQSLRRFLTSTNSNARMAGRELWIDEKAYSRELSVLCLSLMNRSLDVNLAGVGFCSSETELPSIPSVDESTISEELLYACRFWIDHVTDLQPASPPHDTQEHLGRFLTEKLTVWIEFMAAYSRYEGLSRVRQWVLDQSELIPSIQSVFRTEKLASILRKLTNRLRYMDRREEALMSAHDEVATRKNLLQSGGINLQLQLSQALCSLSTCQHDLAQRDNALETADLAVEIQRKLVASGALGLESHLVEALLCQSIAYTSLRRPNEAIMSAEEAVETMQQSGGSDKDVTRPSALMAEALRCLSFCLTEAGQHQKALETSMKGVQLYRQLTMEEPTAFIPDLAVSVLNLSRYLANFGRHEEALVAGQETVEIYKQLIKERPLSFTPNLARSLVNLALYLSNLGRHDEALSTGKEAIQIYRQLTKQRPAVFTSELALSLINVSKYSADIGLYEPATVTGREAADIYRSLTAERPLIFTPELALSLSNLAMYHLNLGLHNDAFNIGQEAVQFYRKLAEEQPAVHLPNLARSLLNLSMFCLHLGNYEEAMAAGEETAQLYRTLATEGPAVHLQGLARCLLHLSVCFTNLGRHNEALTTGRETVGLYQKLADERPAIFTSELANSLTNLSKYLSDNNQYEEALAMGQQAVEHYRQLAKERATVFTRNLARSLLLLSTYHSNLDHAEEALKAGQEGARLYGQLAKERPAVYTSDHANALHNLSCDLDQAGRHSEALTASKEAVALYRTQAAKRPTVFDPPLAASLSQLADILSDKALHKEALEAIREAIALYRPLIEKYPEVHSARFIVALGQLVKFATAAGQHEEARIAQADLKKASSPDRKN